MSRRRIRRPKEHEEMYSKLTDRDEFGVFSSYKDVFMLAGVAGYMNQKRKDFTGSLEGISWNVFNLETDEAIINGVALAETGDVSIINTDDESFDLKMLIFEEYAAGGLEYIYQKIMENPRHSLDNYFNLIKSMELEISPKEKNLKEVADFIL